MVKQHSSIIGGLVIFLMAELARATTKKFTVFVARGKLTCFNDVLEHKGIFKISYQILGMGGHPLKLENPDDSIVNVYFSRSTDGSKLYRNTNYTGTHSHTVYGSSFFITFCAENYSEDMDLKFSVELAWALDINDFSSIPLTVVYHMNRTRTAT
jgi:hypothetical protein